MIKLLSPQSLSPNLDRIHLPLLLFFSGMDGSGLLAQHQIESLSDDFDLRCLVLPTSDRSSWQTIVAQTHQLIDQLQAERSQAQAAQAAPATQAAIAPQAIYLCGESFGACIALQIAIAEATRRSAAQCSTIHRLILINPATAFRNLPLLAWGSFLPGLVPSSIYRFSTLGFAGLLLAAERVAAGDRQSLLRVMQALSPQTVAWRLQLLRDLDVDRLPLEALNIPVLLVAGERDRLLPSAAEIQRLAKRLPRAQTRFLPNSGHACLLEQAVNLGEILRSSPGFG